MGLFFVVELGDLAGRGHCLVMRHGLQQAARALGQDLDLGRALEEIEVVEGDADGRPHNRHLGYGRTEIADAVLEQMLKITFTPRGTTTPPIAALSEKLAQITPGDLERSWAVTGGSEANETAIKIAKAYHKRNGEAGRYKIISRKGSYHGALGLTTWLGGRGGRSDFEPPYPGMLYAPQPNPYRNEFDSEDPSEIAVKAAQAVDDLIVFHGPETVAAVIAEPICADTPVDAASVPGPEYWPMLRQICDRHGVLLIADEVICGFGRTGKWFGINHWDVVPDIMTVAKGIVSTYLPMAAAIATRRVADAFAGPENIFPMTLTFGGHPVTAAAALANIKIIEEENLVENAAQMGAYLLEQLGSLQDEHPTIGNVRGIGLINAVEIVKDRQTKERFPQEMGVEELLAKKFAEHRLILLGIDAADIAELKRKKAVQETLVLRAPRDGVIIERRAVQGESVKTGDRLYTVADLSRVWVQTEVFESDLAWIFPKQPVRLQVQGQAAELTGRVAFVDPVVDRKTRTARVRVLV